jgi:hypothetical protein
MSDTVYTSIKLTPILNPTTTKPTINGTVYIEMENKNSTPPITVFNIYQYSITTLISGSYNQAQTPTRQNGFSGTGSVTGQGILDFIPEHQTPTISYSFNKPVSENSEGTITVNAKIYYAIYSFEAGAGSDYPYKFYIQITPSTFTPTINKNIYIYFQSIFSSYPNSNVINFNIIGFGNTQATAPQIYQQTFTYDATKPTIYDYTGDTPKQGFADTSKSYPTLYCDMNIADGQPEGITHYKFYLINPQNPGYIYCYNNENTILVQYNVNFVFQKDDPNCFSEGTKILCYKQLENSLICILKEEYRLVQDLKVRDLVKSYKHGYRRISKILSGFFINNPNGNGDCMYKMSKTEDNGLIEDLVLTRNHAILVEKLTENEKKETENDEKIIIDDLLCLITGKSDKFEKVKNTNFYNYYHFSLDSDGDNDRRFGVWANGLLVELPSNNMMDNVLKTGILDF